MQASKVGFIGGGQMATALIAGALQSKFLNADQLMVVEPSTSRRQFVQQQFPEVRVVETAESASDCGQVVLAIKPQVLRDVGRSLARKLPGDRLWVSIAAGVSLAELGDMLDSSRIIRVMPNTPAQVGAGAAAMAAYDTVPPVDVEWVQQLMSSVGSCIRIQESLMHAVIGVAGSSPAYIYMIIEALADGGVAGGLSREAATKLSAQSVLGAAKMVLESGLHPGQLKDQVTSPAGTTIAAVRKLESAGLRSALIEAVMTAAARSKEMEVPRT